MSQPARCSSVPASLFLFWKSSVKGNMHKHATLGIRSVSLSVLFHPFITCAAGEQHCIVLFLQSRGNVLEAGSVSLQQDMLEGKQDWVTVRGGVWRLIAESIFWFARWITSRVRLPPQAHVPYLLLFSQLVKLQNSSNCCSGAASFSIQGYLINQHPKNTSEKWLSINIVRKRCGGKDFERRLQLCFRSGNFIRPKY